MHRLAVVLVVLVIAGAAVFALRQTGVAAPVTLSNAQAVPDPDRAGIVRIYLTMENGDVPNRLVSARSPEAEAIEIAGALGDVVLPANSQPVLSGDGVYLELSDFAGDLTPGRLVPITLVFDPGGSVATRARLGASDDLHAMTAADMLMDAPDGAPEVALTVTAEGDQWAVALQTSAFTFVPDAPDLAHVPGEGHGHLYLNGLKLQRMYSHEARFGALPPGRYTVEVTLNANTHQPYEGEDGPLVAQQLINVD